jgi:hypothetical protein
MPSSSRETETSMQSLEAIRGTTPPNLRTHPSTGIPEADSERGSGIASPLPHSVRHVNSFQKELPFTMQRWLADTGTSPPITRLANCTDSPDDMCPPDQEDGDVPAAITDMLGTQSTHATGKTLPSSAGRTRDGDGDISLLEVGAWCSEDLRLVLLEIAYCIGLTYRMSEKNSTTSVHVKQFKNLWLWQKFSDPL